SLTPELLREAHALFHQTSDFLGFLRRARNILLFQCFQQVACQLSVWLSAQVLLVEPTCFLYVETGTRLADTLDREFICQLLHREDFLLRARVPAQKGEEVNERFRNITCL